MVVDGGVEDGKVSLFMDVNETDYTHFVPPGIRDVDGVCAVMDRQVTLFGSRDIKHCQGGNIRNFICIPRTLLSVEINELVRNLIEVSNENTVASIAAQLVSMGISVDIAHWAATNCVGDNMEEKVINAFSLITAEDGEA